MLAIIRYLITLLLSKLKPMDYARSIGVAVGSNCRFYSLHPGAFGSEPYLVSIGDNVTLTAGVRFITHDGSVFLFREELPDIDVFGPIAVGDNSFIGTNSLILPGVTIGRNCIVGACSVVTRNIPDGFVAAGIPAKVVMPTNEYRQKLLERNCGTGRLNPEQKRQQLLAMKTEIDDVGRKWLTASEK